MTGRKASAHRMDRTVICLVDCNRNPRFSRGGQGLKQIDRHCACSRHGFSAGQIRRVDAAHYAAAGGIRIVIRLRKPARKLNPLEGQLTCIIGNTCPKPRQVRSVFHKDGNTNFLPRHRAFRRLHRKAILGTGGDSRHRQQ